MVGGHVSSKLPQRLQGALRNLWADLKAKPTEELF